jgi:enoyl-[acyl-carrier protein] reductase III
MSTASWAIILGASSGFGAASARQLAEQGFDICGVHLDLRATRHNAEEVQRDVESIGRRALMLNGNAADPKTRAKHLDQLAEQVGDRKVGLLLHSLAFGSLRPYLEPVGDAIPPATSLGAKATIDAKAMAMTLDVMAHSLVSWVQDLIERELLELPGARIVALTSAGSQIAWPAYGAVSAAKAALEAHCRQLALELGPRGGTANALCAGVCDTPALRKIPGWRRLLADAAARNPCGRATKPEDVARVVALLARPEAAWINGAVLRVDGGEGIAGLTAQPTERAPAERGEES